MKRRDLLRLTIGGGAFVLTGCVVTPRSQESATVVPPTQTPAPAPTTAPATPTSAPTATVAPTAQPTIAPTATTIPLPTSKPTPTATAKTPPQLQSAIDAALQHGIQGGATPGGVVCIRLEGKQILLAAYGQSVKYDAPDTLTSKPIAARTETLYDLASLTKLFTTTATMRLVEQGRLGLDEPVAHWLPDFAAGGKQDVTLRQLLTHTSGLPADLELWKLEDSTHARIERVLVTPVLNPPGKVFLYSDLGPIAIGHLLEQVVGAPLDRVVHDLVLDPLGLDQLLYRPPDSQRTRVAATEFETDPDRGLVWGEVHDPNAWALGGVAGHAGLFGTAEQLARFGQVFLDGGAYGARRLLKAETVAEMTRNHIPGIEWRGLGWELNARYYMGGLTSPTTYGHTGFTGTSLVVDPERRLVVVLLANRVHPTRDGPSINATRQAVANAAMAAADAAAGQLAMVTATARAQVPVLSGVDVLLQERKDALRGRKVGLVTNVTGRTRGGESTIDALHDDSAWQLAALFSPEHGIRGDAAAGEAVDSAVDQKTGLPIYSLYGATTRPTAAMLQGLDALVYDIQDVGARTYTYISTLLEVMRAGATHGMPVVVLDRPNPIGGDQVEGNVLDPRFASFVGPAPIAMRYGMTVGELAQLFNGELNVGTDLSVVPLKNWKRSTWFDQTGLDWINPSPNLRSLSAATLYPGMVLFEGTRLSEGRGTDRPFEWIGAPWIDADAWAAALADVANSNGVRLERIEKKPDSSKFAGQLCPGVSVQILNREQLHPMALAVAMIAAARQISTEMLFNSDTFDRLAGTDQVRRAIEAGRTADEIANAWQTELEAFRTARAKYLIY